MFSLLWHLAGGPKGNPVHKQLYIWHERLGTYTSDPCNRPQRLQDFLQGGSFKLFASPTKHYLYMCYCMYVCMYVERERERERERDIEFLSEGNVVCFFERGKKIVPTFFRLSELGPFNPSMGLPRRGKP